jgi:hypothetical protein
LEAILFLTRVLRVDLKMVVFFWRIHFLLVWK